MSNENTPDWRSLDEINLLIRRRLFDQLNAAIGALNMLNADSDDYWRTRAIRQVNRAMSLYNAWSTLIRFRAGGMHTPNHPRHFRARDLLEWLAVEAGQHYSPQPHDDRLLLGNRETLQEGLLLLHSAAYSLGPNVHVTTSAYPGGLVFAVRYAAPRTAPETLDMLLDSLPDGWRTESLAFEIARARDFLDLNGCTLRYAVRGNVCEFSVFVAAADAAREVSRSGVTHDTTVEVPVPSNGDTALPRPTAYDKLITPPDTRGGDHTANSSD